MKDHREPESLTDEEAKKLADELGRAEDEALRLFNEVMPRLRKQIVGYFDATGRRTISGNSYSISGRERSFWYFGDRPEAVKILADAGQLELVFRPENADLADILDKPGLPATACRELEKLAERKSILKIKVEAKEVP